MRRLFLVTSVLILWAPTAAQANKGDEVTPSGSTADGDIVAAVSATYEIHDTNGGVVYRYNPGGTSTIVCYYYLPGDFSGSAMGGPDMTHGPIWPPDPDTIYYLYCFEGARVVASDLLFYDPANPLGPLAATERALAEALDRVTLPDPQLALSPPNDTPHLVGKPTWYALATWESATATATIAGVTATVTAHPTTTTWDPGDGNPATTCTGPGQPWTPHTPTPPPCGHTYQNTGIHPLTVTTTWDITWTATTGESGPLGTSTTSTTTPITVRQVQAMLN